ncbi:vitamin K epoxide reductase family protein [Tsukamurella sp. PLM1]|uniref:vitamin K epoxide reductase family protein n=1 Tax=Tsukamurella sp. PLM1 TaxID=2929795 RepID=UPI0020641074|nr:vitamin K epoxide reductase family protein [Tsukamurella sp. PLM1]BDH59737.1 membrane protein [Tsukamurella sp. PLM1]
MPSPDSSTQAPPEGPGTFPRLLPWLLLLGGIAGALASLVLTIEKLQLAADTTYVPSCSLNPVLNCGSVMTTPQAAVLGFPNSLIGIAGFTAISTIGAALLAGARFRRWFWLCLQIGLTAALGFVHWLITQSLYTINALCPYCMIVWAATGPIFWYVTLANLTRFAPVRSPAVNTLLKYHSVPPTIWFLTIITLIVERFWWYWSSLLP